MCFERHTIRSRHIMQSHLICSVGDIAHKIFYSFYTQLHCLFTATLTKYFICAVSISRDGVVYFINLILPWYRLTERQGKERLCCRNLLERDRQGKKIQKLPEKDIMAEENRGWCQILGWMWMCISSSSHLMFFFFVLYTFERLFSVFKTKM